MNRIFKRLMIFVSVWLCFSVVFASEQKGRLYFEGTKVVVSANLNAQPEFVAKVDKIIDAELFSSRIMPFVGNREKEVIKEKISKCDKIECVLSGAKQSGAAVFVRSEIAFLPDSFKGTLKMYETEQGHLLAEVTKIGSLDSPEKQYSEMVQDFVLASQFYFTFMGYSKGIDDFASFIITPFDPVVDFANFSVPEMTGSKVQESKTFPPEQMTEFHDLGKIKDRKLIALYEDALKADRLGDTEPMKAVEAWKKVSEIAEGEIKGFAIKRSNEWAYYFQNIKENELFKKSVENETEFQLFPEMIVMSWREFLKINPGEARAKTANEKIASYSQKHAPVKKYVDERTKLFDTAKSIYANNMDAIGSQKIKINRKIDMFLNFISKYGAVDYDFAMLDGFIDKLPSDEEKEVARRNVYNKWNAEFFKSKCSKNDFQACIIAEQIYRKIKDGNQAYSIQVEGCKKGVLELCASLAQTKLAALNDPELKTLAEKSCAMGSAKGCAVLANFYDIAVSVKPKAKKELLYKVSCERGFVPACKGDVKLEQSAAVVSQQPVAVSAPAVLPEVKKEKPVKEKKERKPSEFLKTHPYFWYGFTSTLAGAALGVVSIYYGISANDKYVRYNEEVNKIIDNIESFKNLSDEQQILKIRNIDKFVSDGDKYKKIAIGTGVAGGALFVTGIILMAVKKPAPDSKPVITFVPS
ncbi:MAG TPA: hypothetical protein PLB16_12595, partial [bacterium]|nr:hypothetical protein [bacterium]